MEFGHNAVFFCLSLSVSSEMTGMKQCETTFDESLTVTVVVINAATKTTATRGRPNFGFGFGAECGQMGTFGGHSVSAESSRTTLSALSVSACCSW